MLSVKTLKLIAHGVSEVECSVLNLYLLRLYKICTYFLNLC